MGIYCRKTGKHHGMSGTPEWRAWRDMLSRCRCSGHKNFKDYGERGITVCPEWENSFINFFEDLGKRPTPKHSLDRKDNQKGYYPLNCRWATPKQQQRNKRSIKLNEGRAEKIRKFLKNDVRQHEIARIFGVSRTTISNINTGKLWS